MNIKHTKEMRGTLLVELSDGNVYEVSRHNSGYSVTPDPDSTRSLTTLEENYLIKMFKQSSCFRV